MQLVIVLSALEAPSMRLTSARDRSMINDGLAVRLEEGLMMNVENEGILCFGTLKLWVGQ